MSAHDTEPRSHPNYQHHQHSRAQPELQQQQQQPRYTSPPHTPLQTQPLYARGSSIQGQHTSPPSSRLPPLPTLASPPYQRYPAQDHSPIRSPDSPLALQDTPFIRTRDANHYRNDNVEHPQADSEAVPEPPPHRDAEGRVWGREQGYTSSRYSNITTGADNFGEQAAGGLSGVAMSVADSHARESGLEAMRNTPGYPPEVPIHDYHDSPYTPQSPQSAEGPFADSYQSTRPPHLLHDPSSSSLTPIGAAAFPPGMSTPQSRSTISRSPPHSFINDPYSDNPYNNNSHRYSRNLDPSMSSDFDPNSIEDDGDDGLEYGRDHRSSAVNLGRQGGGSAAKGAAAGGIIGSIGGLVGRNAPAGAQTGAQYDTVYNAEGSTAYGGQQEYDLGTGQEKNARLAKEKHGKKKKWWIIVSIIAALVVIGALVGSIAGTLLNHKGSKSNKPSGDSAESDSQKNGDLDKNSAEIVKILNNKNLHKVFPGVDYTPMYTQYPDCMHYPPSQNNVTRDVAVLSQLTNTIRLYGTDCNQTELVLHAIDRLDLNSTVKVWMGVWLDKNTTTNDRQVEQMYDIFDKYGDDPFAGVIVGNEVLFRKDMTEAQLGTVIKNVRSNLTSKGLDVAVASSDLGDNWTADFADQVDFIMANIHPFFAGVPAADAAAWTWEFWTGHDTILTTNATKNIISETGWPSKGGTDCGSATTTTCADGSVAGITEMNAFMEDWVCSALANGTNYFWFEAFDEPWKISFNEPGKEWEDQWGLMDVDRNLKSGVVIPDCGGKTV